MEEILKKLEGEMDIRELAEKLNVSERTMRKYLKLLVNRGIVGRKKIGRKVIYFRLT